MKRISLLVVLMVIWANVAFAATNWKWSCSSDEVGFFYDIFNMQYDRYYDGKTNYNVILYWEKNVYTPVAAQKLADICNDEKMVSCADAIKRCSINTSNNTYTVYEIVYYDGNGNVIRSEKFGASTTTVIPDTYRELVFWDVVGYARKYLR